MMVKFDMGNDTNLCGELIPKYIGEINRLMNSQLEKGLESWAVLVNTGKRIRFGDINTGEEHEIDDLEVADAVDDLNIPNVKWIGSIHTHPNGKFLSPYDIETHIRFAREWDGYDTTIMAMQDGDVVTVMAAVNKDWLTDDDMYDVRSILQRYQGRLESEDNPSRFYEIVSEMFQELEEYMNFCKQTYVRQ